MSFDPAEFRNLFLSGGQDSEVNRVYGKRERTFLFLRPKNLSNGEHIIRFLPPMPQKCPMGVVRVATHKVPLSIGGEPCTVECIQTGEQPCAICEVLVACKDVFRGLNTAAREALQTLAPWRRAVFPIAIYAWPSNPDDRQSPWVRGKEEHGAIFEVSAESLIRDIFNLFVATNGKLSSEDKGFYLKLHKNVNSYKIDLINKVTPLQNKELITTNNYPNITKLYLESDKFPIKRLTFEQQIELMREDCWWYAEPSIQEACEKHLTRMLTDAEAPEDDVLGELLDESIPF